jgi:hypothetical protein
MQGKPNSLGFIKLDFFFVKIMHPLALVGAIVSRWQLFSTVPLDVSEGAFVFDTFAKPNKSIV